MAKEVALYGYHCMGNAGDDAMLQVIASRVSQLGFTPLVKCRDFTLKPPGCARPLKPFAFALSSYRARALVLAGGSILHSPRKALAAWLRSLSLFGVRLVALSVSSGPFASTRAEARARGVLAKFQLVAFRDDPSYRWGVASGLRCLRSFDAAVLLDHAPPAFKRKGLAVVVPRADVPVGQALIAGAREFGTSEVLVLSFSVADNDYALCLSRACGTEVLTYPRPIPTILSALASADLVLSVRLHGGIFSYSVGTPFVLINYHLKCQAFSQTIGLETLLPPTVSPGEVARAAERAWGRKPWSLDVEEARERARSQFKALESVL